MAQRQSQKPVIQFNKGFITESGELTFPEGATIDELNCTLDRDGSRRRRLGLALEENNAESTFSINEDTVFTTGEWKNVGGVPNLDYLVVQSGTHLYFYNKALEPLSAQEVNFSVDISDYSAAGAGGAQNFKCQFTSINGLLVVVNPAMNSFYIEKTDTGFNVERIFFKIRDFDWQGDTEEYSDNVRVENLTLERTYDTKNAGWSGNGGDEALVYYEFNKSPTIAFYPPLNLPWYASKDADGNFRIQYFDGSKAPYAGTSLISNGHYILDFFYKNRFAVSGVNLPNEIEKYRFSTVATFQGRVFYSGVSSTENGSKILFSKLLDSKADLGKCYQQNDPTSEEISDLLDTDGGELIIPEAFNIQKLYSISGSLLVFASNGVWEVKGVDGVFRATEYSVSKISNVGMFNPELFVAAEGLPFWWSVNGIHTLSTDNPTGMMREQNLTINTIQSFFDQIPNRSKVWATAEYDSVNKRILWAYPDASETVDNKLNNILIFDLALSAFYKWRVSDTDTNTPYIIGTSFFSGVGVVEQEENIVTLTGDSIVTETSDPVVVTALTDSIQYDTDIKMLVRLPNGKLTVAEFSSIEFNDWGSANYQSYAEAGYDFMGDLSTKKTVPLIELFLRRTEEGFVGDEVDGYDFVRPSGVRVSAYWDFKDTPSTNPQQGYRMKKIPVVNETNLNAFDYPKTVVSTRLKVRGRGKSMRIRFESEDNKDFNLLGYNVISGKNSRY